MDKDRSKQFVSKLSEDNDRIEGEIAANLEEFALYFNEFKQLSSDLLAARSRYVEILEDYNLGHDFNHIPDSQFADNIEMNNEITDGKQNTDELMELQDVISGLDGDMELIKAKVKTLTKDFFNEVKGYMKNVEELNDYLVTIVSNEEVYGLPTQLDAKQMESRSKKK